MTRYLCVDPSHTLGGEPAAIDLTAQVRLEREFLPRESAYLADSGDVIRRVNDLGEVDGALRAAAVRRILTGTTSPLDAPVVLVAGDRIERVPGLYEMDELRRSERSVASLLDRYAQTSLAREGSEDLVVLRDQQPPLRPDGSTVQSGPGPISPMVETVSIPEVRSDEAIVLPQGVYPVLELATRLAEADIETDSLVDVIHATPSYGSLATEESRRPWRVIVECPVATGEPLTRHQMIFTGTGETEPVEVLGTPAVGNDVVLDTAASNEAVMPFPARRAERGLQIALLAAALIAAALLVITWISGGLALAVRETPVWLGLSLTLGVAAMAVGLVALASRSDAEGNTNDTFVLRRHYASRIDMLWYATLATAVLFALSVAAGVVPPILASETPVPSASITFDAGRALVTATVQVQTQGLATDQPVTVQMRQYSSETADGILIGLVTSTGDPSGDTVIGETVSLDAGARYMTVQVIMGNDPVTTCTPLEAGGPGCTVVSVPPLGAGIVRLVPATSALDVIAATEPTTSPVVPTPTSGIPTPTSSVPTSAAPTTALSPSPSPF
jgi:hypothetical protein